MNNVKLSFRKINKVLNIAVSPIWWIKRLWMFQLPWDALCLISTLPETNTLATVSKGVLDALSFFFNLILKKMFTVLLILKLLLYIYMSFDNIWLTYIIENFMKACQIYRIYLLNAPSYLRPEIFPRTYCRIRFFKDAT